MLPLIEKYYGLLIGLLIALLGLAMGQLAAVGLGIWLQPDKPALSAAPTAPPTAKGSALSDYESILQRNLFDPASRGGRFEKAAGRQAAPAAGERAAVTTVAPKDMALFGTIAGGDRPLALLRIGGKMVIGHLGDKLPGGAVVEAIERTRVVLLNPDGSAAELLLHKGDKRAGAVRRPARGAKRKVAGQYQIQEVGENRWVIPKEAADRARGNLGELLKTAHMVPNVVDGKTVGFTVRMIQPRSLLALLGLKRGDVLHEVNGVSLNSPEKALQIFQQLREARSITIGLERGGKRMTFDYEVE